MKKLISSDIGEVNQKGTLQFSEDSYIITAGGKDIWGKKDEAHFAYCELECDFDISVRIESLTMPDLYTKAGIMARETIDGGSKHVYILVFGDNSLRNNNNGGYELQYRDEIDGDSVATYPPVLDNEAPLFPVNFPNTWIRLQRIGNEFVSYYSENGVEWKEYGRHISTLKENLLVGICVTAHSEQEPVKCKFSDLLIKRS